MTKWKTKDGRLIRICDLGDEHLVNIIDYLRRRYVNTAAYYEMDIEAVIANLEQEKTYQTLFQEAINRDLHYNLDSIGGLFR